MLPSAFTAAAANYPNPAGQAVRLIVPGGWRVPAARAGPQQTYASRLLKQ
ncbi:hypothetical protein [Hymenobacter nivis]|nr:hypothetical protein [Hymenobacter nivis]